MELFNILACEVNGVEIADSIVNIFKFLKHYYETRQIEYDWY